MNCQTRVNVKVKMSATRAKKLLDLALIQMGMDGGWDNIHLRNIFLYLDNPLPEKENYLI